jgi:hypothetical protein
MQKVTLNMPHEIYFGDIEKNFKLYTQQFFLFSSMRFCKISSLIRDYKESFDERFYMKWRVWWIIKFSFCLLLRKIVGKMSICRISQSIFMFCWKLGSLVNFRFLQILIFDPKNECVEDSFQAYACAIVLQ